MYLHWNATSLNVNSFAFHMIKTLLQIVEAFQEPYYSHDTSLISIMYAKPDTFDSEGYVALSVLNLQRMHVLQYSRCPHSIKHLTKQNKTKKSPREHTVEWKERNQRKTFGEHLHLKDWEKTKLRSKLRESDGSGWRTAKLVSQNPKERKFQGFLDKIINAAKWTSNRKMKNSQLYLGKTSFSSDA